MTIRLYIDEDSMSRALARALRARNVDVTTALEEDWKVYEKKQLERITVNPAIFGGKPIIRGRRLAVEHVLGLLAAGDAPETILIGYPWLEAEDIRACLVYGTGQTQNLPTGDMEPASRT